MTELVITRGLPASGKTTWAIEWIAAEPSRARSNRDDLRATIFGGHGILPRPAEDQITRIQRDTIRGLLAAGWSVVIDDMHLRQKYARAWADFAQQNGADFRVVDFPADLDVCIARDAARERSVGEKVLRDIHARFCGRPWPSIEPTPAVESATVRRYSPDERLPLAWLVDVDGTLARMIEGGRGPFDWHRVSEDEPHTPVVEIVRALGTGDHWPDPDINVVVMSGREDVCRDDTAAWLEEHNVPWSSLHMRAAGDQRKDSIVKAELFWEHVAPKWNVRGVIDDRNQVVEMWRAMGLVCLQAAPGDF